MICGLVCCRRRICFLFCGWVGLVGFCCGLGVVFFLEVFGFVFVFWVSFCLGVGVGVGVGG